MKNKEKDKISFQKTKVDSKYDLSLGQKTFHPRGQHPSLSVSNTGFQKQTLLPLNFKAINASMLGNNPNQPYRRGRSMCFHPQF